jgi:predicted branched-subunit amino acid permease
MTSDNMREFLRGIGDQLPLQLGVVPFGLVFGVLGIASGLSPLQTILMSSIVFGGASQVVFAQLWATGASPLIVGSSVLVINLRHMLYSAAVAKYLRPLSLRWRIILGYLLTDEAIGALSPFGIWVDVMGVLANRHCRRCFGWRHNSG